MNRHNGTATRAAGTAIRGPRMHVALLAVATSAAACPLSALAQTAGSFAYCTVEDAGKREIWVSQVFEAPPSAGPVALELATDFHAYVGSLGGAGTKQCVVAGREQAAATRARVSEIMNKRVFGMRVYKWHDVQWAPNAAAYAAGTPRPAAAGQFVYCRTLDTGSRTMVTTPVFQSPMPGPADSAHYIVLDRYSKAFAQRAAALHRVAPDALCIASDTRAEADKNLADYRHAFPFAGVKQVEMPWQPDASLTAVPALPATASAVAPSRPAAPVSTPTVPRATPPKGDDDVESEFWRRISTSGQAADYEDYLAAYPQGRHAPIARLEVRRLGGRASATSAAAADASTAATSPTDASVAQRVASEAFFRLPAGSGAAIERSGTRMVGTVAVKSTTRAERVAGSNVCRFHNAAAVGTTVETIYDGDTWAGLIPLSGTVLSRSAYGNTESNVTATSIGALQGQPFPLVEGNTFAYTVTQLNVDRAGTRNVSSVAYRCRVGRTGPADAIVPGLAGEQTEVQCTMEFGGGAMKPMQMSQRWYSATGCFLQDPDR